MMKAAKWLTCASAALTLSGCVSTAKPMAQLRPSTGFSPTVNHSPMDRAIMCMSQATGQPTRRRLRLAVGQIKDYTGKFSNEASEGGFKVTQGASLMIITALGKLDGIDQVERFDTTVSDQEATLAKAQLIKDNDPQRGQVVRPLTAGMYDGSDYFIVGGVTEANYTLSSGGAQLGVAQIGGGSRYYVMNVAADLRLVETKTLHVVKTISVQKQIVGREVESGVFNFLGNYLVDINAGSKTNEPMQMGVRSTLELGTLELLSPLYDNYFEQCRPVAEAAFGGPLTPEPSKPGPLISPSPAVLSQGRPAAPMMAQAQPPRPAAAPIAQPSTANPVATAVIAPRPAPTAPTPAPLVKAASKPPLASRPESPLTPPSSTKIVAQIGALPSSAAIDQLWRRLNKTAPGAVTGRSIAMVPTRVNNAILYRAEVSGFPDRASAKDFCETLSKVKQDCFVRS